MAKLLPPFILCPLSESKLFLGMSSDKLENKVILTIGKNIAIRYHVLEQKQEVSWISSRHWFTSRVVYCSDLDKYGAVIDYHTIILFDESDSNLGSVKKYKFNKKIMELKTTRNCGTLAVFQNGAVKSVAYLASLKKETMSLNIKDNLNEEEETLLYTEIDEKRKQALLVIGFNNEIQATSKCGNEKVKKLKVIAQDLRKMNSNEPAIKFLGIIQEGEEDILGSVVNISSDINNSLIYSCSNGYLYRKPLESINVGNKTKQSTTAIESNNEQPLSSSKVALIEKHVSNSSAVVIKSIDSSSVIIYGCDPSEEGATVFVYDISYNILLTKQSLKLYSSPPIMERVGQHIFVGVGLHILVLNLRLTKSRLSSVLGKHQIQGVDFFEKRDPWIQPWVELSQDTDRNATATTNGHIEEFELMEECDIGNIEALNSTSQKDFGNIYKLVKTLETDGQPESMICGQIVPQVLEAQNTKALEWLLDYFDDIPESSLIAILIFLVSSMDSENLTPGNSPMDVTDNYSYSSNKLINKILQRNFDQRQLIRELRTLDFDIVRILLQYFCCRMNELWVVKVQNVDDDTDRSNHLEFLQLLKWACVIFDAHYPQFVFNNETELTEKLLTFVNEKFTVMNEVESLEPLLTLILSKVSYEPKPSRNTKFRTETVTFE